MVASFQKLQFAPVPYVPPENLPARRKSHSLALSGYVRELHPAVGLRRAVADCDAKAAGSAEVYNSHRETVSGANAGRGRLIDIYA
jgi:hypothetical protein